MIENCYDGAQWHDLPYASTRELLIAAMFHDFNHSGGEQLDSVNISRALTGVSTFFKEFCGTGYPHLIHICIKCTEYPFVVEPCTIEQRIIRDADLMQFRYPNWQHMYEANLKREIEVKIGHPIPDEDMLKGQSKFWADVVFYTDWGLEVYHNEALHLRARYGHFRKIYKGVP
jgi:hypothetical protein